MKRKLPQVAALPHDAPDIPESTPENLLPEKPEGYSRLVIGRAAGESIVIDCNGVQTQYDTLGMVLIPGNVTRGTVTLKRVKAHIGFFQEAVNPTQLRFQLNTFQCLLQLVPLSDGQPFGMLAANNAGDLESNRIIWRQTMHYASTPTGVPFTGVDAWGIAWSDIDVKSQRRFSRAQWALVFTCTALATWQDETRIYANFRMLFATGDGM